MDNRRYSPSPASFHQATITRYINDYLTQQKLDFSKGGSSSYLTSEQTQELVVHLTQTLYHHTHEIVNYIASRWRIHYSVSGLNKWLHRLGFSYKKPKGRPYKADVDQQAAFMAHYEKLKQSRKDNEKILFMDCVHPTQATKLSYGWICKGKTHDVSTTASRTRLNLRGAIELNNIQGAVIGAYETLNVNSVIDFFNQLREKYPIEFKLHLVLDQAGYNRAEALKQAAKKFHIELHYLPAYSPNLNPIERLWKIMNEHVRNNHFFKSAKEFRERIWHFFKTTLPDIGCSLDTRINDNFQKLMPAYYPSI